MMSSQDPRRQPRLRRGTRTVSLSQARAALIFSLACATICAAVLVFFAVACVFASAPVFLLAAPALGAVSGSLRAVRWSRAVTAARSAPDEYRWRP